MAGSGVKPRTLVGWLAAGTAGVVLATPRGREWVRRAAGGAAHWLTAHAEELGEVLGARIEGAPAERVPPATIHGAASRQMEESMIVARVREALARESGIHAGKIHVLTIGGVVHLEGSVEASEEKELAGRVAQDAARAHILVNDLQVAAA